MEFRQDITQIYLGVWGKKEYRLEPIHRFTKVMETAESVAFAMSGIVHKHHSEEW